MNTKYLLAILLPGLITLFLILPHAKAVTTIGAASAYSKAAPSLPCGPSSVAAPNPATMTAEEFPVHLLDAKRLPGFADATPLTESLWLNPNQVVNVQSATSNLAVFDLDTGKQTPVDAMNALYEHQEAYKNPFSVRTSPDGRWLLWPSDSNGEPTWEAVSLDGQQHREWPRATDFGTLDVAWMQDSRHWVQLSQFDLKPHLASVTERSSDTLKVRVYDTKTPQVQEYPLVPDAPQPGFLLPTQCPYVQFTFTQDGRAWLSILWSGCSPTPQFPAAGSRMDAYELVPGQDAWTLKKSYVRLGSYVDVGCCDECVRSPDDNWLIWRNYVVGGKGLMHLVLTRADGSDPQVIQTGDSGQSFAYTHWAADSQHVAFYRDNGICQVTLTDLEARTNQAGPCGMSRVASRIKATGAFPVTHLQTLLAGRPH